MSDRLEEIREAAERAKAQKEEPLGRWMPLATFASTYIRLRLSRRGDGSFARDPRGGWCVLYPGNVEVGQQIGVLKKNGGVSRVWVKQVVKSVGQRTDGNSVVTVSWEKPQPEIQALAPTVSTDPMPEGHFVTAGPTNPRICEKCEGPCRPGAGMCDGCKKTPSMVDGDRS